MLFEIVIQGIVNELSQRALLFHEEKAETEPYILIVTWLRLRGRRGLKTGDGVRGGRKACLGFGTALPLKARGGELPQSFGLGPWR